MKIIIFDFEVFKYDTLLGALILDDNKLEYFQTWDLDEIKKFYIDNQTSIWIGWNITKYDNLILEACVTGKNPKKVNDEIIKDGIRKKVNLKLYYFDLITNHQGSLKSTEAYQGKNISETQVDFDLDRKLTEEEKLLTEKYNRDDLDQTYSNFLNLKDEFILRCNLINEFNLTLNDLSITGTQIAEKVLGAQRIHGIENQKIEAKLYDNLELKNEELKKYFLEERFRTDEKLSIEVCGLKHQIGAGGIHAAEKNCTCDKALYLDVSGYYNLIMLNYDLLPRTLSEKGKEQYDYMYHQQLKLKGIPEKATQRNVYKAILLSVFGAMLNEYSKFYDPQKGLLVTITGQLFIVDLLEKLEGKIRLIQSNTDGIIVKPLETSSEEEILQIVKDWCTRTNFVIKPKKIYRIVQRDVNNYLYEDEHGNIEVKGEAIKHYKCTNNPFQSDGFASKEPLIVNKAIVEYFTKDKLPEETVNENQHNLKIFQYICKKNSFDYAQYEKFKNGQKIYEERIQSINRAFASNDLIQKGMIIKYKNDGKKAKISNLPESVFIYNDDINSEEVYEKLKNKIDWSYYILRSYERIIEFKEGKGKKK